MRKIDRVFQPNHLEWAGYSSPESWEVVFSHVMSPPIGMIYHPALIGLSLGQARTFEIKNEKLRTFILPGAITINDIHSEPNENGEVWVTCEEDVKDYTLARDASDDGIRFVTDPGEISSILSDRGIKVLDGHRFGYKYPVEEVCAGIAFLNSRRVDLIPYISIADVLQNCHATRSALEKGIPGSDVILNKMRETFMLDASEILGEAPPTVPDTYSTTVTLTDYTFSP